MIAAVETKFAVGDRVRVLLVNPLSGSLRGKEFEIADTSLLSKGQVSIRTGKKSTWPIEIRELELVEKAAQDLSIVPSPFAETYEAEGQAIKQEMEQAAPATLDSAISSLYQQATEAEALQALRSRGVLITTIDCDRLLSRLPTVGRSISISIDMERSQPVEQAEIVWSDRP